MRTKEEFVRRWRCHLAGMALYGTASEIRDGPLARASRVLDIPAEVERLLGKMYDELAGDAGEGQRVNGHALRGKP